MIHFQHLGLHVDVGAGRAGVGDVEAADDDEVRVQSLGDADGGGSAGAEISGKAEVFQGIGAVVAADGQEAGGGEALVESVGKGVADPIEVRLAGAVVEGKNEDEPAAGAANVGGGASRVGGVLSVQVGRDQEVRHVCGEQNG